MKPLARGSRGDTVATVQKQLNALGYDCGAPDGIFGPGTEAAVKRWETDTHVTGVLDADDLAILIPNQPRKTGDGIPTSREQLIELYGQPWGDPAAWWAQWGAPANIGLAFSHVVKPRTIGGVRGCYIWVNRDIVDDVESIFGDIKAAGLAAEVRTFDGCYNVRSIRGRSAYSLHTWGIALDINAATNGLGVDGDMHPGIIAAFKSRGWVCGADFRRRDFMHFQRFNSKAV